MNKLNFLAFLFLTVLCCGVVKQTLAQTTSTNPATVNVDNLSDAQLRQYMQQAKASGQSDAQIIQTAQARGMSPAQIQSLQSRVNEIRRKDGSGGGDTSATTKRDVNYQGDSTQGNANASYKGLMSKVFGSNLFRNSKSNGFQPNLKLPTPINYIVGPEDQLSISVYGNSVADWILDVSPEGNINVPGVGIINVGGKTIEQATTTIKSKLKAYYAIDKGSSLQVTLGNIRSIKVIIQGEVNKPGTYTLSSLSTVFNALYEAGGPNVIGSFRNIEVLRNNRVVRHLDLYDFLVKGSQKDNIALRDQDIIRIPPYSIRVELKGEVKIPGLFETLPGEKLQDIINFSGGFTDEAYTQRIKVAQVSDRQRRLIDVVENDYNTYIPLRGDVFTVDKILDRYENRVTITGAVFRPGDFELQNGLTLSQLIKNAGGLKEDAFTARGSIVRLNADNSLQQISFNIADILNNHAPDVVLQREDKVTISSVFDLRNQYTVNIKGEVRKPGDFPYADSMKVADLIIKAGGFAEGASAKRIEVSRRVFDSNPNVANSRVANVFSVNIDPSLRGGDANFTLKPFDIVSIYSLPGFETQKTVKVEGEVIYPGYYTIQTKNEKISDVIVRAGGLTASADVEGSSLKRDNAAVLGVDKNKIDTVALNKERTDRLRKLQHNYQDSVSTDSNQFRNNYIGIDLKKILKEPGTGDDLILENGDVLRVPKQQQTVKVNGEVLYPSAVVYSSGKTFKGYIFNSGGFSPNALRRGAYVVYPNGTVKGTRKFLFFNNHPQVKPGSEIFVPRKPASSGTSITDILGFTTGLASLGAIILGLISLNK